ncbi:MULTISPECIES: Gfo/Idh/MocA family oxidoreductase [Bacillaceae]|uniref:Gfo/Idh/MocA family protein n=1 Tax=Bacillaceae TaxID=186817 RepID=UPI001E5A2CA5|nr:MULTISPECIES: Gfo/Idh/MocA family oxidoreductase [Bacillaceae]MCE4049065.1 Gfo/Idh/MocA family oxidoreductase [Bacillus sp. Au-Bac7]MCM3030958.1 Gfo/Idh/MocA family oxidoreductase [Niallia sp. MER 6]UPO90495.1 Gfo/Idh/MocA family oxidoreductase [Niallia sp. Man26]
MKIATIGTGFIVEAFLQGLEKIASAECVAIYSRKEETAQPLAAKYEVNKIYTDLDALFADDSVEIVYIASPNSLHFDQAYRALEHGKHVICEKPFTSTLQETDTLISLAKQNNLMLFEAITTIHLPNYQIIKENINKIGQIKLVQCNYSQYSSKYNALLAGETPNVFNPQFSGGSLVDINIYNLHFVMGLFGTPEKLSYTANKHSNGIDTSGVLLLTYPDFIAVCAGAKDTRSENFVMIQGEKGYIHVENGANGCRRVILHNDEAKTEFNEQTSMNNLYYELLKFNDIYKTKDYNRCYSLLDYSRSVMEKVVEARMDANIIFAADNI